jgi:hypothetical protein
VIVASSSQGDDEIEAASCFDLECPPAARRADQHRGNFLTGRSALLDLDGIAVRLTFGERGVDLVLDQQRAAGPGDLDVGLTSACAAQHRSARDR